MMSTTEDFQPNKRRKLTYSGEYTIESDENSIDDNDAAALVTNFAVIAGKTYSAQFVGNGPIYIEEADINKATVQSITTPSITTTYLTANDIDTLNIDATTAIINSLTTTNLKADYIESTSNAVNVKNLKTSAGNNQSQYWNPTVGLWTVYNQVNSPAAPFTIESRTIPANLFNTNGGYAEITVVGSTTNNANAKSLTVKVGGTQAAAFTLTTNTGQPWRLDILIVRGVSNRVCSMISCIHGTQMLNTQGSVQGPIIDWSLPILIEVNTSTTTTGDISKFWSTCRFTPENYI